MRRIKRALRFAYALAHVIVELGGDVVDAARARRRPPVDR